MTSAEQFVNDNLERGYDLAEIRDLASTCEQPLADEILAAIAASECARRREQRLAVSEQSEASEVACETALYHAVTAGEEAAFLIGQGEENDAPAEGINFNLLQDSPNQSETPVLEDESVADIVIGETDGSDIIRAADASAKAMAEADPGLWSRLWTRVAGGLAPEAPSVAPSVREELGGTEAVMSDEPVSEHISEALAEAVSDVLATTPPEDELVDPLMETDDPVIFEVPTDPEMNVETVVSPLPEQALEEEADTTPEAGIESTPAAETFESPEATGEEEAVSLEPVVSEESVIQSEMSSDYLPGSVAVSYDETGEVEEAAIEAPESVDQAINEFDNAVVETASPVEELAEQTSPAEQDVVQDEPALEPAEAATESEEPVVSESETGKVNEDAAVSRRQRRRRDRAEKKRKRKQKNEAAALPEIVLTRSEGTETLQLVAEAEETPEDAPAMSAPMSLVTPNDVFEDAESSSFVALFAAAMAEVEGPQLSIVTDENHDSGADDHTMIISNGGVSEDELAQLHLVSTEENVDAEESVDDTTPEAFDGGANVILFRENFPFLQDDGDLDDDEGGMAALPGGPVLHLLSTTSDADNAAPETTADMPGDDDGHAVALTRSAPPLLLAAPTREELPEDIRAGILSALYGSGTVDDLVMSNEADARPDEHAIVSLEPVPEYSELFRKEHDLRISLEQDYQNRLDDFAARLLMVQTAGAESEEKLENAKAELEARAAILEEMKTRLEQEEKAKNDLASRLECTTAEMASRERELEQVRGLKDEHQRLYNEFEDLRKAYNEVVTDVMPTLQNERDDLALTVERQVAEERKVRSELGSTRRRLTVGYGLGVAASLVLIALPVANWLKSSERAREAAESEQLLSELRDTLQQEVDQNIQAQNVIVELQNKVNLARAQIVDLQSKNRELAQVRSRVMQPDSDIAVFRPESSTGGTPTRASTMALQATPPAGGKLHVNEIRDPAGSIEQVVAMNRARNQNDDAVAVRPAGSAPVGRMQVNAVARVDGKKANSLRPASAESAPKAKQVASAKSKPGEVLATVKKGEGVAQVVYRVLGTWNPEVVAWVIRENRIKSDRRGNPIIQPNQQLRLPEGGNIGQAASAARR